VRRSFDVDQWLQVDRGAHAGRLRWSSDGAPTVFQRPVTKLRWSAEVYVRTLVMDGPAVHSDCILFILIFFNIYQNNKLTITLNTYSFLFLFSVFSLFFFSNFCPLFYDFFSVFNFFIIRIFFIFYPLNVF